LASTLENRPRWDAPLRKIVLVPTSPIRATADFYARVPKLVPQAREDQKRQSRCVDLFVEPHSAPFKFLSGVVFLA